MCIKLENDLKEKWQKDLLYRKANICVIGKKEAKTKKKIVVFKSPYSWVVFDGYTKNPYVEIERIFDLDLNGGLDADGIVIQEITI